MEDKRKPTRNIALELVRVTEAGALAAGRHFGRGDKIKADGAAVDAMRLLMNEIDMDGKIVIGEGEKDQAPMLFNGEMVGNGEPPELDIAVDPVEGTTLLKGRPWWQRACQTLLRRSPPHRAERCLTRVQCFIWTKLLLAMKLET